MRNQNPRYGFTFWQVVLVLATLVFLAAILFPVFERRGRESGRSVCQSNLKRIGLGFKQYIQDYDEKYPVLATAKPEFGWASALQPYLKSTQIFQCDKETNRPGSDPTQAGYTDYWFNARMGNI